MRLTAPPSVLRLVVAGAAWVVSWLRDCLPGVLSASEAYALSRDIEYRTFEEPLIARLVDVLRTKIDIDLGSPSYVRVEARIEGHPWHTDLGNKTGGTRGWNKFSASVLLTPPEQFTGGGVYFRDQPDTPIHNYCDLWYWDHNEEHCAPRHHGDRRMLLMFFQGGADG
jgi:hypothetical protein